MDSVDCCMDLSVDFKTKVLRGGKIFEFSAFNDMHIYEFKIADIVESVL